MRITCPQCHTRCRLKADTKTNPSQGKCPECGHIFSIPPGVGREETDVGKSSEKLKKTGFGPGFLKSISISGKTSLFWIVSGFCLVILVSALLISPDKTPLPHPGQKVTSNASPTTTETPAKLSLPPDARSKAIAQIKYHALVGDAEISISGNQLQLALLVSGNTPITYAERLGRQFAHYLKEQLTATHQPNREPSIKISVYYPGGTRIEVATNDQSGEEEVLPKIIEAQ
ncbi:MAG: hypothetical protein KAI69_05670 [Deltaproteobacteria bacterium]|nr:hypothetical protein [Deltaproteobacteria bacterium]